MSRTTSTASETLSNDASLGGEALLSEALLSEAATPPLSEAEAATPPLSEDAAKCEVAKPIVVDDNQGQGGSYILDSETGVRTLIQRTLPSTPNEVSLNGPSDSQASDLGEDRDDLRD